MKVVVSAMIKRERKRERPRDRKETLQRGCLVLAFRSGWHRQCVAASQVGCVVCGVWERQHGPGIYAKKSPDSLESSMIHVRLAASRQWERGSVREQSQVLRCRSEIPSTKEQEAGGSQFKACLAYKASSQKPELLSESLSQTKKCKRPGGEAQW